MLEPRTVENEIRTRVCKRCSAEKGFDAFSKERNGFRSVCRDCINSDRRSLLARKKEMGIAPPHEQVEKLRARSKAYYEREREKVIARSRESYQRNKEIVRARSAKWKKANREYIAAAMAKRRAKGVSGECHTKEDIKTIYALQRGMCAVCRCQVGSKYHVDHIVPIKLNGGNDKNNIQILCQPCNSRKSAKHPIDFMQEKGYLL